MVKLIDSSKENLEYSLTGEFYLYIGFRPLEVFTEIL